MPRISGGRAFAYLFVWYIVAVMKSDCLFIDKGVCIGVDDLEQALRKVGVRKGQVVLVHAGLHAFGKLGSACGRATLCKPIIRTLEDAVGRRGTLVMPTFTYAFCSGKKFDRKRSSSEVGALTEFFRAQPGVIRSLHPIFSVAAKGARAGKLTTVGSDSFGPDSFFAHLLEADGIIVFFGATFHDSCTFIHHIEQVGGIPYRFLKTFHGTIKDGRKTYEMEATFFVRPLDGSNENDSSRLEALLRHKGFLKETRVGAGTISAVRAADVFRAGIRLLDEDQYALVKRMPRSKKKV